MEVGIWSEHLGLHHDVSNLSTMELIFVCQDLITESLQTDPFVCMKQFPNSSKALFERTMNMLKLNVDKITRISIKKMFMPCTIPLNINQSVLFYFPGHNALLCVACANNYYAVSHKYLHFRHNIGNSSVYFCSP